jgi:hypothetical protein
VTLEDYKECRISFQGRKGRITAHDLLGPVSIRFSNLNQAFRSQATEISEITTATILQEISSNVSAYAVRLSSTACIINYCKIRTAG